MDADDYGSIPLPKDYAYKPIPNEGKEFFYGPMGNAVNFCGNAPLSSSLC